MVHDKKRSGDPDYDDKVPLGQQLGQTVKGPEGQDVLVTESTGPVNPDGSHANLDEAVDERDNRPPEGGVATEPSEVQVAEPVRAPAAGTDAGDEKKSATKRR